MGRQIKAIEAFEVQAVKSAEETKGRVDGELRELGKTLENIETARPFEDLTVVSVWVMIYGFFSVMLISLCPFRMKLLPHDQISTLERNSLCRRGVGTFLATRYMNLETSFVESPMAIR